MRCGLPVAYVPIAGCAEGILVTRNSPGQGLRRVAKGKARKQDKKPPELHQEGSKAFYHMAMIVKDESSNRRTKRDGCRMTSCRNHLMPPGASSRSATTKSWGVEHQKHADSRPAACTEWLHSVSHSNETGHSPGIHGYPDVDDVR